MKMSPLVTIDWFNRALFFVSRQSYDGLEKKLKEVFSERSSILHQLSKTSKELDSIKGNLQVGSIIMSDAVVIEGQVCSSFWTGAHVQPVGGETLENPLFSYTFQLICYPIICSLTMKY